MATPPKTTSRVKRSPAKKVEVNNNIVVVHTSVGETLVIRSNPTDAEVKGFVAEHTRRQLAGEASGFHDRNAGSAEAVQAHRIFTAHRFEDEAKFLAGEPALGEIDIADLLPTP